MLNKIYNVDVGCGNCEYDCNVHSDLYDWHYDYHPYFYNFKVGFKYSNNPFMHS